MELVWQLSAQGLPSVWRQSERVAQARIGSAGAGVIAEKPEALGTIILLVAIPETMVILGFAIATMILLLGG